MSEVLITLVVIGIIAAITIPSISKASEKYILRNQFKKTYSTIMNAMKKADTDLGGNTLCYYLANAWTYAGTNTDCPAFYEQMLKNLNVQKVCEGNAKTNGCIPNPYMQNYVSDSSGVGGFSKDNIENNNTVYNLADGTIIIMYRSTLVPIIMVDINGAKGPNMIGKDIFSFLIESNGQDGLRIRNRYISAFNDTTNRYFNSVSDIYKE